MKEFFLSKYSHKIKKSDQLLKIVGKFPRKRKIIMCHGNFDIVHPGHVRHLTYAKSKASILVASITADKMIKKGTHRPHVPQKLRALNLAAFEMVDYVIIDNNLTPIENIKKVFWNCGKIQIVYKDGSKLQSSAENIVLISDYKNSSNIPLNDNCL